MNNSSNPTTLCPTKRIRILRIALACAPLISAAAYGSDPEPKDFSKFEGLNLKIQDGKEFYPMLGFYQNAAEIKVGNELKFVPFSDIKQYRIVRATLIRSRRAELEKVDAQRVYTPGNDPRAKWSSSQAALTTMRDDDQQSAEMQYLMFQNATASGALQSQMNSEPNLDVQNGGNVEEKIQDELDKKLFDAVQFQFKISSPKPIPHPYVIIITDVRDNEDSNSGSRGIYIKQLDPIDSKPQTVTITQGGFPRGFILDKYQIHVFDNGQEVATNLSKDRVDMTRGEVFEYLDRQYAESHKGQTASPAVIQGSSQGRLREMVDGATLSRTVEIKVGKDGQVLESSYAAPDSGAVPEAVRSYLRSLRFYPALENGVPVDGRVDLKLADLAG